MATILNEADVETLRGIATWVRNFRGAGVVNGLDGAAIVQRRGGTGGRKQEPEAKQEVTIVEIGDNHLVCRPLGMGEDDSSDIYVAKSYDIRVSTFDGQTIPDKDGIDFTYEVDGSDTQRRTSTNTDDSTEEIQEVIPQYVAKAGSYAGSHIFIERLRPESQISVPAGGGNVTCEFQDDNRARAWTEVLE